MLVFVISLIKPNILTKFKFIKSNKIKTKKNLYKKLKILKNATKKNYKNLEKSNKKKYKCYLLKP